MLHYIGAAKPWHSSYDVSTGQVHAGGDVGNFAVLLKLWWNVYMQYVRPSLEGPTVSRYTDYYYYYFLQWRIQDFCKGVRQLVPLECPKPLHALSPSDR